MGQRTDVAALVLAAGTSSRMADWKPLLPLGGLTVLARAVGTFLEAGVTDVRVVVGFRAGEITPLVASLGAAAVQNPRYRAGMYSSVLAGVESLGPAVEAFFLLPGDHPLVKPRTVQRLLQARESGAGIIYPCFRGQRGHPPLISTGYAEAIRAGEEPGGLRAVLARFEEDALEIHVADHGVLANLNTPADYERAAAYIAREDIPTAEECQALLEEFQVPPPVVAHSLAVAQLAGQLATRLSAAGVPLNGDLVIAGALLHDVGRGRPDHARVGARLLRGLGYGRVSEVVASHMEISLEGPLDEAQIVYLADKMSQGTRRVTLAARQQDVRRRFAGRPEALAAALDRLGKAETIRGRIEAALGRPLEKVIGGG